MSLPKLLRAHLDSLVLVAIVGAGCAQTTVTHCTPIEADATCPTAEHMTNVWQDDTTCTDPMVKIREVVRLIERRPSEQPDTAAELADYGEECCYEVRGKELKGAACIDGRPLLEGASPLVAKVAALPGWSAHRIGMPTLPAALRDRGQAHWLKRAVAEHASIAAFARTTMELLAHGAPPELLRDLALAQLDETRHAEDAFAIASALAGQRLGPGPLRASPRAVPSLSAIAEETLLHGVIGETIAALVAAEQCRIATVPAVRLALGRVVDDEARHAALAWRILRWSGWTPSATAIQLAEDAATATTLATPLNVPPALQALGIAPRSAIATALASGLDRVLRPGLATL